MERDEYFTLLFRGDVLFYRVKYLNPLVSTCFKMSLEISGLEQWPKKLMNKAIFSLPKR
jgi:hypothetical protein